MRRRRPLACNRVQCECGLPVPHKPHELGCLVQVGASSPVLVAEANIESFLVSLVELQCGHRVPVQSVERTRTSLFRSHFSQ
jgi:hypothetical protein